RRRPRGDLSNVAPVAARGGGRRGRRAGADGRAAHGALFRRPAAHPSAARVRRGGAVAPAPPRPPLPRRSHGVVPLLLAAGRGRGASARALSPAGRLARVVDAGLLARVPRPSRGSRRLARAAAVHEGAAGGLLLLAAVGAPAA